MESHREAQCDRGSGSEMTVWDRLRSMLRGKLFGPGSTTSPVSVEVTLKRGSEIVHQEHVLGANEAFCFVENSDTGNRNRLDYAAQLSAFRDSKRPQMVFEVQSCETQVKFGQAIEFRQNYTLILSTEVSAT